MTLLQRIEARKPQPKPEPKVSPWVRLAQERRLPPKALAS